MFCSANLAASWAAPFTIAVKSQEIYDAVNALFRLAKTRGW